MAYNLILFYLINDLLMKLSLIITTYNWPEALSLVLESVRFQSIPPNEIIIADDGSTNKTKDLIKNFNEEFFMEIIHSWHADMGFRAARARNNAILKSNGDYIVLIDGDTILHPKFIENHINSAEPGYFVQGTRALLSIDASKKAIEEKIMTFPFYKFEMSNKKNAIYSKFLSANFSTKKNHIRGIKSCNMAFYRSDFINVNGFNNDFEGWGREDSEFIVRLLNNGVKRKNVRFSAIQYHLWHNENTRLSLRKNDEMLKDSIENKTKWCENGINSIKTNES